MKKSLYAVLLVILLTGSFLAGSWYDHRKAIRDNSLGVKSSAANADSKSDTDTDMATFSPSSGSVKISHEK